jgi:hypothetical protein
MLQRRNSAFPGRPFYRWYRYSRGGP